MNMTADAKPLPEPTALAQPFWTALKRRELRLQRCTACGNFRHPPKIVCPRCHDRKFSWDRVEPVGTLYSFTIVHRAPIPAFQADVPYAVGLVDIAGTGVRLLSTLEVALERIAVGMALEVRFDDVDGFTLFRFKVPGAGAGAEVQP